MPGFIDISRSANISQSKVRFLFLLLEARNAHQKMNYQGFPLKTLEKYILQCNFPFQVRRDVCVRRCRSLDHPNLSVHRVSHSRLKCIIIREFLLVLNAISYMT